MSAPPLREALTNELSIKRFSLIFNKVFDLPDVLYKFEQYEECTSGTNIVVTITLSCWAHKIKAIVELSGPLFVGKECDWGLHLNTDAVLEDSTVQVIEDEHVYRLYGYLRPV